MLRALFFAANLSQFFAYWLGCPISSFHDGYQMNDIRAPVLVRLFALSFYLKMFFRVEAWIDSVYHQAYVFRFLNQLLKKYNLIILMLKMIKLRYF